MHESPVPADTFQIFGQPLKLVNNLVPPIFTNFVRAAVIILLGCGVVVSGQIHDHGFIDAGLLIFLEIISMRNLD